MFNAQYFSPQYFHSLSWRFDLREQTITYARVAAHVRTGQSVVFAYSQESLRVATKISYPVAFVTTGEASAHVKPLVAKVMTSKPARRKSSAPVQRNAPAPKRQSTQQKAFVLTEKRTAQVSSPQSGVFVQQPIQAVAVVQQDEQRVSTSKRSHH